MILEKKVAARAHRLPSLLEEKECISSRCSLMLPSGIYDSRVCQGAGTVWGKPDGHKESAQNDASKAKKNKSDDQLPLISHAHNMNN